MIKLRTLLLQNKLFYILLIISLVYCYIFINTYNHKSNYNEKDTIIEGKIINYSIDGNKLSTTIKGKDSLKGTYYFESLDELNIFKDKYSIGDSVRLYGSLIKPSNNTIPNTFNYNKYLKHNKIYYIFNIDKYELIHKNNNIFIKLKNYVYKRISNIENNEYLYAFILGNSNYIENNISNNYKINGITHLFALSGLHVSIISSIIMYLLNKIRCSEVLSFIIVSLFLILLCFVASFTPSIVRATILFMLGSINKIYYFFIKTSNLLYLTFIIMILFNPFNIFNLGFQLSFIITYFIIILGEQKDKQNILTTSIISFISSLPIIINNFYNINILSFINNLFFIPYVSYVVYPFSLMVVVFPFLNKILLCLTNIMEFISKISTNILNYKIIIPKMSIITIIIFYILLILFVKYRKKILLLGIMILFIINSFKAFFDNNTYIYFLDVSQGDSIYIRTQNNKNIIIDTGGKMKYEKESWEIRNKEYNMMNDSITPFLYSNGVKTIDYLILTHGDADHMGESINMINNFNIRSVVLNIGDYNALEKELINILEEKNINYSKNINSINIDKIKLLFLNTKDYYNENENSNVIYANINKTKILLMGDAGADREKDIIKKYNINNIDILKVGHHGSDTSSSKYFINAINPKTCIISVGKNNKYGHPKKSVLDTLNNCNIYRTDIFGSIKLTFSNEGYLINTINP